MIDYYLDYLFITRDLTRRRTTNLICHDDILILCYFHINNHDNILRTNRGSFFYYYPLFNMEIPLKYMGKERPMLWLPCQT